jgi:pyrroloquinoline quinone (PQQ) biosynthesis protein C
LETITAPESDVQELLESLTRELEPVERAIRGHRYVDALERGKLTREDLVAFAGQEYPMILSDRRSFAYLASRFPTPPAADFFLTLAQDEWGWLMQLVTFAEALGCDEEALRAHEPKPKTQVYTMLWAWLALNGSRADAAIAVLVNLTTWGVNCGRMAAALRTHFELPDRALSFFDAFAAPAPEFETNALAVVAAGLRDGESAEQARRAARFIQNYELLYWDALAEAALSPEA